MESIKFLLLLSSAFLLTGWGIVLIEWILVERRIWVYPVFTGQVGRGGR